MIHYSLSMTDYLKHPGLGSSTLKHLLTGTPADFYAVSLNRHSASTPAMELGTAIHTVVLEPHLFDQHYLVQDEDWGDLRSNPGRTKWDTLKRTAEFESKSIIKYQDAQLIKRVGATAANHVLLNAKLRSGKTEVTAFCDLDESIQLKARADLLTQVIGGGYWIWDIKTTSESSLDPDSISRLVYKNGYGFQAVHHMYVFERAGLPIQGWGWIFVTTKTPVVHVVMRKASEKLLSAMRVDHEFALDLLKECSRTGEWYGYGQDMHEVCLPKWIEREYA